MLFRLLADSGTSERRYRGEGDLTVGSRGLWTARIILHECAWNEVGMDIVEN